MRFLGIPVWAILLTFLSAYAAATILRLRHRRQRADREALRSPGADADWNARASTVRESARADVMGIVLLTVVALSGCASGQSAAVRTNPDASGALASTAPLPDNGDPAPRDMVMASDSTYGRTTANPIKVGGAKAQQGAYNERAFLDALRGPNGEAIHYERNGSCCQFKTPNAMIFDIGMLDIYTITYDGAAKAQILYINMYDYETPRVPVGLTRAR